MKVILLFILIMAVNATMITNKPDRVGRFVIVILIVLLGILSTHAIAFDLRKLISINEIDT